MNKKNNFIDNRDTSIQYLIFKKCHECKPMIDNQGRYDAEPSN